MRKFLFAFVILCFVNLNIKAQENLTFACTTEKPISRKDFKRWAEKDVGYIIEKTEKESFFKLQNDEDRNTFIENFWSRRDPDSDTEENEYRTEYCERVNETKQFESGLPGWKTDRGRFYILYGKADEVERGYSAFRGDIKVLYEKWKYNYISGIGSDVEIFFIDPTETNEFRLVKNEEGKLLEVFTRNMDEETLKLLQKR